ncbi:MAG: glycosyltransferase family 4 protein [Candidatus Aenigmatarchaeota archaeon]
MKIAILTDLFYPYQLGGAERQFYEVASRLAKKHQVHVFTLNLDNQPSEEILNNIHIHRFGLKHSMKKRSLLALASFFLKTPFFLKELKKFDIIHANQIAGLFSFFRYFIKKPFLLTIHDLYWNQWKKYYRFPFYYMGKAIELFYSKLYYSGIITVSEESARKIKKLGFKPNTYIIPNGIDFDHINKTKTKKSNHLVYVGRLVNYKNVDKIIQSMPAINKLFPKLELHIIGTGDQKPHLEKLANKLNANVKFLGYVSEEEKFQELKSAQAFISMSSVEGFGISVLEAMASGTPVVIKTLPCYDEFCDSKNSLRITEQELSKTIINLIKNKSLQKTLTANGLATAKQFDWNNVVKKLEKVYESLI